MLNRLAYERINKKLNSGDQKSVIEKMLFERTIETNEIHFQKNGKNIYISNIELNIKITINSNTYRIITVDQITKNEKQNDKRI